jgi:hypothetical protein
MGTPNGTGAEVMILYRVHQGIITAESVLRETKCGWRQRNNGFINRNEMNEKHPNLSGWFYTTDLNQALRWADILFVYMRDIRVAAMASIEDIENWAKYGSDEGSLPESRLVNLYKPRS